MKKIIYTFIFLLPIFLLSCEQEIVATKAEKENTFKNYLTSQIPLSKSIKTKSDKYQKDLIMHISDVNFKPYYFPVQSLFCYDFIVVNSPPEDYEKVAESNREHRNEYRYSAYPKNLAGNSCWEVDNESNVTPYDDYARRIELCVFKSQCELLKE